MGYSGKDSMTFWKTLNSFTCNSSAMLNGVKGVTEFENVAEMWRQDFCDLLNSNSDTAFKSDVLNLMYWKIFQMMMSPLMR
jgi:hypothetical protein